MSLLPRGRSAFCSIDQNRAALQCSKALLAVATREGERSGYFKVTRMEQHKEPARGFNFTFDWSGNSKSVSKGTTYTFTPPHYNGCGCISSTLCFI